MSSQPSELESDPAYAKLKTTDVPWYREDITLHMTPKFRVLLEQYSGIDSKDVSSHVSATRERLWARRTYPCVGLGVFQIPWISHGFFYPSLLSTLKSNASTTLLDIGCFIGHDLRHLVFDGARPHQLFGVDIVDFWDLGFELFRDGDKEFAREVKYSFGDVLDLESMQKVKPEDGKFDVVYISQVLHQFEFERQVSAAKNLVALTQGPGSRITGAQIGFVAGRFFETKKFSTEPQPWGHDEKTWSQMWERVGKETGTRWDVQTSWKTWQEYGIDAETTTYLGDDARILEFDVKRLL